MKAVCIAVMALALLLGAACNADTLSLKNGDHLTGMVTSSDGKQVTLKTDYAGEIKVNWSAVKDLTADKPLYVVTADKKTVNGNVALEGTDLVVHTAASGDVRVPLTELTVVRSADDQQAYEKSLHPGLINDWKGGVDVDLHWRGVTAIPRT